VDKDAVTDEHHLRVVRLGPQFYVARCTCGYVGQGLKSERPFWSKGEALAGVFRHQKELGLEPEIEGVVYTDLAPRSSR
jgi:hypothetical protein